MLFSLQRSRQFEIISTAAQFVSDLIDGSQQLSLSALMRFGESLQESLQQNSLDAVQDYLIWYEISR